MDQIPPITTPEPITTPAPKPPLLLPILLTFSITSFLFIGGYFGYRYFTALKTPSATPTPTLTTSVKEDLATDWKTYSFLSNNISIKYPPVWSKKTTSSDINVDFDTTIPSNEKQNNELLNYTVSFQIDDPENYVFWSKDSTTKNLGTETINNIIFNKYITADMYSSLNYIYKTSNNKIVRLLVYPYDQENFPQQLSVTISKILSTFKFEDTTSQKQLGYIKSITADGDKYSLTIDYIEMIQDQNQPNGFRINNTNPKLRTFVISPNAKVIMQSYSHTADGSFAPDQSIPLQTLVSIFTSSTNTPHLKEAPYWITLQNNQVATITEQYLP